MEYIMHCKCCSYPDEQMYFLARKNSRSGGGDRRQTIVFELEDPPVQCPTWNTNAWF